MFINSFKTVRSNSTVIIKRRLPQWVVCLEDVLVLEQHLRKVFVVKVEKTQAVKRASNQLSMLLFDERKTMKYDKDQLREPLSISQCMIFRILGLLSDVSP